jgi:hypothetical protein
MNAKAKGTRNEHCSRLLLEAAGYAHTPCGGDSGRVGSHWHRFDGRGAGASQDAGPSVCRRARGAPRVPTATECAETSPLLESPATDAGRERDPLIAVRSFALQGIQTPLVRSRRLLDEAEVASELTHRQPDQVTSRGEPSES